MTQRLNARIGRIQPRLAVAVATAPGRCGGGRASAGTTPGSQAPRRWTVDLAAPFGLLAVLLAALWPHWVWMARRLTDGSDEPWGVLALATVLGLVFAARRELRAPSAPALAWSAGLALVAALAQVWMPPLVAAALAMLALAAFLTAALPGRPRAALASLLLLALPVIASLQFYLGYPLRFATAHLAAPLLGALGIEVVATGAALASAGQTVLVDPPCAGIAMLWIGSYLAALLSYLNGASARRTFALGLVAALFVFVANVLRNAVLFFPQSGRVDWPQWSHEAVGLAAFALAVAPLVWLAQRQPADQSTRSKRDTLP